MDLAVEASCRRMIVIVAHELYLTMWTSRSASRPVSRSAEDEETVYAVGDAD